jgi:hypothetical protein
VVHRQSLKEKYRGFVRIEVKEADRDFPDGITDRNEGSKGEVNPVRFQTAVQR